MTCSFISPLTMSIALQYTPSNPFQAPMPSAIQKQFFDGVLESSLGDECSAEVLKSVHQQAYESITMHREAKIPETLTMDRNSIEKMLYVAGVSPEKVNDAGDAFEAAYGADASVPVENLLDTKHFVIKADAYVIKGPVDMAQEICTKTIGGIPYICVPANCGAEINGVQIVLAE